MSIDMERCMKCKDGYFKSDKGGCYKKDDPRGKPDCHRPDCKHCLVFEVDDKVGREEICTECNDGWFKSGHDMD